MVVFRFCDRTWNPFRESKIFFSRNLTYSYSFLGEIYRGLPCRRNHSIIISRSRSKVEKKMMNSVFSNFDCDPEIILKWLQHHGNVHQISPKKTLRSTFFSTKKRNIPSDIPKSSFSDFETETETPFGNRKFFFLQILVTRIAFWGKIYWELLWRWIHYIIISGSRSKVEKTMKNSVFSNFNCDPEIMMKWLQHHGNRR